MKRLDVTYITTDRLALSIISARYTLQFTRLLLSMPILDGLQYVNRLIGQLLARKWCGMCVNRPLSCHEQDREPSRVLRITTFVFAASNGAGYRDSRIKYYPERAR